MSAPSPYPFADPETAPAFGPLLRPTAPAAGMARADLDALVGHLLAACRAARGIGIAANQLGIDRSVALVLPRGMTEPLVLIDPAVLAARGRRTALEGCLSLPGLRAPTTRPTALVLETSTLDGERVTLELLGESARIASHETDHLVGRLFVRRVAGDLLASARIG